MEAVPCGPGVWRGETFVGMGGGPIRGSSVRTFVE